MSKQTLKDAQNRVIGFIDTASNGDQTALDAQNRIIGFYKVGGNYTQDAHYRTIGFGNLLGSLL